MIGYSNILIMSLTLFKSTSWLNSLWNSWKESNSIKGSGCSWVNVWSRK